MTEAHATSMIHTYVWNNLKRTNRTRRVPFVVTREHNTEPKSGWKLACESLDRYKSNSSKRLVAGQASPKFLPQQLPVLFVSNSKVKNQPGRLQREGSSLVFVCFPSSKNKGVVFSLFFFSCVDATFRLSPTDFSSHSQSSISNFHLHKLPFTRPAVNSLVGASC